MCESLRVGGQVLGGSFLWWGSGRVFSLVGFLNRRLFQVSCIGVLFLRLPG